MRSSVRRVAPLLVCALALGFFQARASIPSSLGFASAVRPSCEQVTSGSCGRNSEPAIAVDPDGNLYLSSILGVPGGVNLWKRPAGATHLVHLGIPDADPTTTTTGFAIGGGDIDLAVATARNTHGNFNVYAASLSLASITFMRSEDGGANFTHNYVSTAPISIVDRQWIIGDGASNVYLVFRDEQPQWYLRASTDGGDTFGAPVPLIQPDQIPTSASPVGLASRAGNIAMDHASRDVYVPFANAADALESTIGAQDPAGRDPTGTVPSQNVKRHVVYLSRWHEGDPVATNSVVYNAPAGVRVDAIFPTVGVDAAGTVYVAWSTTAGIFMASSTDHGAHFGAPIAVSSAPANTTIQPWIAAGDAGKVAVAYLGTDSARLDDPAAKWFAYVAQSTDGGATFTQVVSSGHSMHTGTVCLRGLQCDIDSTAPQPVGKPAALTDRSLAEVTALAIDSDGMLVTSWPDNGDGGATFPQIAKQSGGVAMIGTPSSILPIESDAPPGSFAAGSPLTLNFHNAGPGATQTPDGYQVDGGFIVSSMSDAAPSNPHVGIVGYATTYTPGASRPAIFQTAPLAAPLAIGGSPVVKVWVEGESGAAGTGVVDYRLVEVRAGGGEHTISARGIAGDATDACCRYRPGADGAPVEQTITYPAIAPALIPAGSSLRLELRFTAAVHSATRLFYDALTRPSSITLITGTFS